VTNFDGFGPDDPPLPWTEEVSAELHDDADMIFKARLAIPHLIEHDRNACEKVLHDRLTDFTDAMVAHGKYSHAWPDGLTVKIYGTERKGRRDQILLATSRIYYAEKSAT
jgi:hypothetical protein